MQTLIVSVGAGLDTSVARGTTHSYDVIGTSSRARAIAAAILYRRLPDSRILFCGGRTFPGHLSEAEVMRGFVTHSRTFGVPESDVLVETESLDTAANVRNAVGIINVLDPKPGRIVLVTHKRQLARATKYFEAHGLHVTPLSVSSVFSRSKKLRDRFPDVDPVRKWRSRDTLITLLQFFDRKGTIASAIVRWRRAQ